METESSVPSIEEGSEFDQQYRFFIWAVDVLLRNDPQSDSIEDHNYVDADLRKKKLPPPEIYQYLKRLKTAKEKEREDLLRQLNEKYKLLEMPQKLEQMVRRSDADDIRKDILLREIKVAEARLHLALSEVKLVKKPTPVELWRVVNHEDPPALVTLSGEIQAMKDMVLGLLSRDHVHVTNRRTLRHHLGEWEEAQPHLGGKKSYIPAIEKFIREEVETFIQEVIEMLRLYVPELAPFLDQIILDGLRISVRQDMRFDAGLTFIGGDRNGIPTGEALYEWNGGRAVTKEEISYIATHEATHWLQTFIADLLRRAGKLGPEVALVTMGSPRQIHEEGLAQCMKQILAGGSIESVVERFGEKAAIVMVLDRLQDLARMYGSIGYHVDFAYIKDPQKRLAAIRRKIREQLVQAEAIVNKYAGKKKLFWRSDDGIMMGSVYHDGTQDVLDALNVFGIKKVLAVATRAHGDVDAFAFAERI